MSNKLKLEESLSALMDSEADDLELRRILKELPEEPALKQKWERYHLVSATLKQESHTKSSVDLLSAIHLELADDPAYSIEQSKPVTKASTGFIRVLSQGAIAASVALAVFVGVGSFQPEEMKLDVASAEVPQSSYPTLNGDFTSSEFSRTVSYDGAMDAAARLRLKQAVYQILENSSEELVTQETIDQ